VLTNNFIDEVQWWKKAYSEGLMSKDFAVAKGNQIEDLFNAGSLVLLQASAMHQYNDDLQLKKTVPDGKAEIVPFFKVPKGVTNAIFPGFSGGPFFPKTVPQEKLLKILDYYNLVASEEISTIMRYGFEGIHYTVVDGVKKPTEQGTREVNFTTNNPFALKVDIYDKVDVPSAPKEVNEKNRALILPQMKNSKVDPFVIIQSETWSSEWPKYTDQFDSIKYKVICGAASIEELTKYQDTIKNKPEFKKAFKELAQSYKEFFGN